MSGTDEGLPRTETDASLRAERQNTDYELARRVTVGDADDDEVLRRARERADRLLAAARAATDARLPLNEQTQAAVELLLEQRGVEDRTLAAERQRADDLLERERKERREQLSALLVLERQATDLHLGIERQWADKALLARDDFLAQASHDLHGLMAAHRIYLALLVKATGDGEYAQRVTPYASKLLMIDAQIDRIISDLVDTVAIDAGKLAVRLAPTSAAELVAKSTSVFEPLALERGQFISVTPAPADATVMADSARAVQVLGNLLSNAIKFTPSQGEIQVGFDANADVVTFFVSDGGPGVPAEEAEHIFERFVGSNSSSHGLGLGLYISAQLVRAHGGRLWLDRGAQRGATFRFTLNRFNPASGA
ncbi:MAG TPA: HAMP domain-containing sensor histidine kinase [Polyangiaceae bacterium]|nr:HAMP domain-containing sensor histidine kinase [Polyangiaceae bacterium]